MVMLTVACKNSDAADVKTNLVRVPGDGSFRYAISDMVDRVQGTIVSIQVEKKSSPAQMDPFGRGGGNPFDFFFGPGFGPQMQPREQAPEQALGSGVVVSKEGYILTNNHVVTGADKITVTMLDEKKYTAKIIGRDEATDLAVIKIESKDLKNLNYVEWGDSDSLRVGEWVVAIGNPFGLDHTVTTGIVSAKGIHGRGLNQYENFIQVDAAINPGNSGGALLNLDGRLVGINSAILSRSGGFQGIGFAIPVNMARKIMTELIEKGSVTRGFLGVGIQDLSEEVAKGLKLDGKKGSLVTEVMPNSPAEKGGLQVGDLITGMDGKEYKNTNDLRNQIALTPPGTKVKLNVIRSKKELELMITITTKDGQTKVAKSGDEESSKGEFGAIAKALDENTRRRLGLNPKLDGVFLSMVSQGSVAEQIGLNPGDVILRIGDLDIKSIEDYQKGIADVLKSKEGAFLIYREGARMFIGATLP